MELLKNIGKYIEYLQKTLFKQRYFKKGKCMMGVNQLASPAMKDIQKRNNIQYLKK